MSFFIHDAYAVANNAATNSQGGLGSLWLLAGFVILLYVLMWLPQSRRAKEHRQLINNLTKGDEVLVSNGILGKVTKIAESFVTLSIADNVEICVQKTAISALMPKGTLQSHN